MFVCSALPLLPFYLHIDPNPYHNPNPILGLPLLHIDTNPYPNSNPNLGLPLLHIDPNPYPNPNPIPGLPFMHNIESCNRCCCHCGCLVHFERHHVCQSFQGEITYIDKGSHWTKITGLFRSFQGEGVYTIPKYCYKIAISNILKGIFTNPDNLLQSCWQ